MSRLLERKTESRFSFGDRALSYLLLGFLSFVYFIGLARINPDPHHDGVQFAAAAGVADGLHIHSQVYEQYGPMGAWIQGATLKLFGSTLLTLRLENVVVLTIAALLLLRILFILRVPEYAGILICLIWVLSCPASSVYPGVFGFWPWSSTYALIFLLDNAARHLSAQVRQKQFDISGLVLAGLTCSVVTFTRFQVGLVATAANVVLIFAGVKFRSDGKNFQRLGVFALSVAFFSGFIASVLSAQGSWVGFVDQIIVGPLHQYVYPYDWKFFGVHYLVGGLPTLVVIVVTTVLWRNLSAKWRVGALALIALVFGIFLFSMSWNTSPTLYQTDSLQAAKDIQPMAFLFLSVVIFLILGFFVICFLFSKDFLYSLLASHKKSAQWLRNSLGSLGVNTRPIRRYAHPNQRARRQKLGILATLLLLEFPFLVQLYPLADVYHLWWVAPLFLVLTPYILGNFVSRQGLIAVVASFAIPTLILLTATYVNLLRVPRLEIVSGALKGMQVEERYVPSYTGISAALDSVSPQSARFYCPDGLLSSWTGSYLSIDASYVSWAWVQKNPPTSTIPQRVFICGTKDVAQNYATANFGRLVGEGVPYLLSYWSGGTLFEFTRATG